VNNVYADRNSNWAYVRHFKSRRATWNSPKIVYILAQNKARSKSQTTGSYTDLNDRHLLITAKIATDFNFNFTVRRMHVMQRTV